MKNNLTKCIKCSALSLVLPIMVMAEVHASAQDIHDIIDVCSSSERIMKDYSLEGMKVTYLNPHKDLVATAAKLDKDMEELESHKITKKLHAEEEALQALWKKMEHNLTKGAAKETALTLYEHVDKFANTCDKLAEELAKTMKNPAEQDIVLIGEMNRYVQELAATYVMAAWGILDNDQYHKDVKSLLAEYHSRYETLMAADATLVPDDVKATLKKLKKHFMFFEVMTQSTSGRYVPLLIAKKANHIHEEIMGILHQEEQEVEK